VTVVLWLALLGGVAACFRWAGVFIGVPHTWKSRLLAQLLVSMRGREITTLAVLLVGLTYLVAGIQIVLLFCGGRPIHDRLARTVVRSA